MLSVIIPTCNRNELLGKCLDNLHPSIQLFDSLNYEVIVTDDSAEGVEKNFIVQNYIWAQWVQGQKKGPAANRNNGAKYAKGEWLIFLDDDVIPGKNLLSIYKENIEAHPETLAFEGAILPDDWDLLKKDLAECPVNTDGGLFWSANICIEKKLFESVGGFNEQFKIAAQEDQQLKIDIENKILNKIIFLKGAEVIHPVRYRKLSEKLKRVPVEIKNWLMFAKPQHTWPNIFWYGAVSQIKACIKTIKENKFGMMIYHLLSLAFLIPGIVLFIFQHDGKQKI